MLQLFAKRQGMATQGLMILASVDRKHLLQHVRRRAIGHQRREMSLQPVEFRSRPAIRRPVNTAVDPTAGDATEPRQPDGHLAKQRCDPVLAVILHVTGTVARATGWPPDGMVPGLRSDNLALDGGQQLLRLSQAQAQIGEVANVIRLRDLHHVRAPTIAVTTGFHKP